MPTLLTQSSVSVVLRVLSLAATLLLQVMLARQLGDSEYGLYMYFLALATVLGTMSTLGFDTFCIRNISSSGANGDSATANGTIVFSTAIVAAGSLLLSILFMFSAAGLGVGGRRTILAAAALIPVLALGRLRSGIFRGFQRPVNAEFFGGLAPTTLFLAIILLFPDRLHLAHDGLLANNVAVLLGLIAGVAVLLMSLVPSVSEYGMKIRPIPWVKASSGFLVISISQVLLAESDVIMIGVLSSSENSGYYSAATRLAALAVLPMTVINQVAAPKFAKLFAEDDLRGLQKAVTNAARLGVGTAVCAVIPLLAFGGLALNLFGENFATAQNALWILAGAQLVNAAAGPVGHVLMMTGHSRRAAVYLVVSSLLNITLNAIAIPVLGLTGAAVATGLTIIVWNFLMLRFVRSRLRIRPSAI